MISKCMIRFLGQIREKFWIKIGLEFETFFQRLFNLHQNLTMFPVNTKKF